MVIAFRGSAEASRVSALPCRVQLCEDGLARAARRPNETARRRGATRRSGGDKGKELLDLRARELHNFLPFVGLGLDDLAELLGGRDDRHAAMRCLMAGSASTSFTALFSVAAGQNMLRE
jgi:hypothetical protein